MVNDDKDIMSIEEALAYIKEFGTEFEIRLHPMDLDRYSGMYEVRCNEPEMIGGGATEQIEWMNGYRQERPYHFWMREPAFKVGFLTEWQVRLLAHDLKEREDDDKED